MNYLHALVFYRTITPLHVGCGQAVGVVDLPVIRERATGYPYIPGSGIRGSLRDIFETRNRDLTDTLFGPDNNTNTEEKASESEDDKYAGCIAVHDARLLFYPVRSDQKVFLWITCLPVLERFKRDLEAFDSQFPLASMGDLKEISNDRFVGPADLGAHVHLEEFRFQRAEGEDAGKLAGVMQALEPVLGLPGLAQRTVLVSAQSFYHFVNYATMLVQHNTLTSAKTVKGGMLFSVESLPPETVCYGMIGATSPRRDAARKKKLNRKNMLDEFRNTLIGNAPGKETVCLHLGGKESTGLGVTQLTWHENQKNSEQTTNHEASEEN